MGQDLWQMIPDPASGTGDRSHSNRGRRDARSTYFTRYPSDRLTNLWHIHSRPYNRFMIGIMLASLASHF